MEKTVDIVQGLNADIERIISLHVSAKGQVEELKNANIELKNIVEQQKKEIEELKEKNKLIKIAKSLDKTDGASTELKYKINEILREVDRCIALLNK